MAITPLLNLAMGSHFRAQPVSGRFRLSGQELQMKWRHCPFLRWGREGPTDKSGFDDYACEGFIIDAIASMTGLGYGRRAPQHGYDHRARAQASRCQGDLLLRSSGAKTEWPNASLHSSQQIGRDQ